MQDSLLTPKAPQNSLGEVPAPQPLKLGTFCELRELKCSSGLTKGGRELPSLLFPPYTCQLYKTFQGHCPTGSSENLLKQLGCACARLRSPTGQASNSRFNT